MKRAWFIVAGAMLLSVTAEAKQAAKANAGSHRCAEQAKTQALKLLKFYSDNDERAAVGDKVRTLPAVKAPRGTGRYDVLEVDGYIYKGKYRIRIIYAQQAKECLMMGQEILEISAGSIAG